MSEIEIIDVAMRFRSRHGELTALERISLTVPDGQFACIVGPSGCGKSTLLMVAAGLIGSCNARIPKFNRRKRSNSHVVTIEPTPATP